MSAYQFLVLKVCSCPFLLVFACVHDYNLKAYGGCLYLMFKTRILNVNIVGQIISIIFTLFFIIISNVAELLYLF